MERPAKLLQSSPWWYFYPGQQAPPGVYITHTLPHMLSSYHFLSDTLLLRPCPSRVSLRFHAVFFSPTLSSEEGGGAFGCSMRLQLEALAACPAVSAQWSFGARVCVCACVCQENRGSLEFDGTAAVLRLSGFIDFSFHWRQTGGEFHCWEDLGLQSLFRHRD